VLGESGFEKVKKLMKERQDLFQNLQLTSLKGGHHVHMESAKELAGIIKNHCQLKNSD
jgi:shikimate kinase